MSSRVSDLSSVATFVRAWTGPLDILVNNAGVMAVPDLTLSPSGHEMPRGVCDCADYPAS